MKRIRPADAVILLLCLTLAAASLFVFARKKEPLTARIYDGGALVKTVDLTAVKTPETLTLSSGIVIEVFPGGARFVSSPCRGQDCVRAGPSPFWSERSRQRSRCLRACGWASQTWS